VHYLHLANPHAIVHRDLKPSNVLFAGPGTSMGVRELALDTGVAKVADFGLSKTLNATFAATRPVGELNRHGVYVVPSAAYHAPHHGGHGRHRRPSGRRDDSAAGAPRLTLTR
jgi:serine/threonine protein kinase